MTVPMSSAIKQEYPPLLELGFHPMSLAEMRATFVDSFRNSKRRKPIMDGLEKIIQKLIDQQIEAEIWVNGSFLTTKIDPLDSDILVIVAGDFFLKCTPAQKGTIRWLNDDLRTSFLCHSHVLFTHAVGHSEYETSVWYHAYWLRQFGFNTKNDPKGIAVIKTP
jgi:hypothetical protein